MRTISQQLITRTSGAAISTSVPQTYAYWNVSLVQLNNRNFRLKNLSITTSKLNEQNYASATSTANPLPNVYPTIGFFVLGQKPLFTLFKSLAVYPFTLDGSAIANAAAFAAFQEKAPDVINIDSNYQPGLLSGGNNLFVPGAAFTPWGIKELTTTGAQLLFSQSANSPSPASIEVDIVSQQYIAMVMVLPQIIISGATFFTLNYDAICNINFNLEAL